VNSLENSVVRRLLSPKKHVVTTDFRLSKAEKKPLEQPEIAEKRLPNGLKWGGNDGCCEVNARYPAMNPSVFQTVIADVRDVRVIFLIYIVMAPYRTVPFCQFCR